MKFMKWSKDGGPDSTVEGFFLIEIKGLFSIVLLKFSPGSRDAFHTHAFNCFSWLLKGELEEVLTNGLVREYEPSAKPFGTYKNTFHMVISHGTSWVLSFRGPWADHWYEKDSTGRYTLLSEGRVIQDAWGGKR